MNKNALNDYITVVGKKEDGTAYKALVKGTLEEIRQELIECMGIVAYSKEEFEQELEAIGIEVVRDLDVNSDLGHTLIIPINLLDNEDLF